MTSECLFELQTQCFRNSNQYLKIAMHINTSIVNKNKNADTKENTISEVDYKLVLM